MLVLVWLKVLTNLLLPKIFGKDQWHTFDLKNNNLVPQSRAQLDLTHNDIVSACALYNYEISSSWCCHTTLILASLSGFYPN